MKVGRKLLLLLALTISVVAGGLTSSSALAADPEDDIHTKAVAACATLDGVEPKDYQRYMELATGKQCVAAFKEVYGNSSQRTFDEVCEGKTGAPQAACLNGRKLGKEAREKDNPVANPNGPSRLTDAQVKDIASTHPTCQAGSTVIKNACMDGFVAGYQNRSDDVCDGKHNLCKTGYTAGKQARTNGITSPGPTPRSLAVKACEDVGGEKTQTACEKGYAAGYSGGSKPGTCDRLPSDREKTACNTAFDAGKADKANGVDRLSRVTKQSTPAASAGSSGSGCTTTGGFGWVVCGLISFIEETITWIEKNVIEPFLVTKPLEFAGDDDSGLYKAWDALRGLANVFFVLGFIGVIFANVFGMQAYNIKKVLPKLVVAAILVQASYLLVALMIDVSNVLGGGLRSLIDPFVPKLQFEGGALQTGATIGAATLIAFAAASKIAAVGIFFAAVPLLLGMLAVMLTLVLRQAIIVVIILLAPIAIASMVLPGTEKLYKAWLSALIRVVLMYPIIVLLFMVGKFAAFAAGSAPSLVGGGGAAGAAAGGLATAIGPIIAVLCLAMPLLAVPFAWAFAGGVAGKIGKMTLGNVSGLGGKLQGSRWNNDRLQQRKENAAMRYTNSATGGVKGATFGRVQRATARLQTGNILPTASSKMRMAAAYNSAINDRSRGLDQQFTNMTDAQRKATLTKLGNGEKVRGFTNDQATQVAALRRMMRDRNYDELRSLDSSTRQSQAWRTAVQPHIGDLLKEAPDLHTGNFSGVAAASAPALTELNHTTLSAALRDPTGGATAARLLPSIQQLSDNSALRAKMSPKSAAELAKHSHLFAGQTVTLKDGVTTMDGQAYINSLIDVDPTDPNIARVKAAL